MSGRLNGVLNPILSEVAGEFLQDSETNGFIGTKLFPIFGTAKQSSVYPTLGIEAMMKERNTLRAPRSGYDRGDWKFGEGNFFCKEYGLEEPIDQIEAEVYADYADVQEISTERAMKGLLRGREMRIAKIAFDTDTIENAAAGVKWNELDTAKPRSDVMDAKSMCREKCGLVPNYMTVSYTTFQNVLRTKEITEALKYTNPIELGGFEAQRSVLAQYFGVDQFLVGDAMYDLAKKGKDAKLINVWDDTKVLLSVVSNRNDLREPTFGRTFQWDRAGSEVEVEEYRDESIKSDIIRASFHSDEKLMFKEAGFIITGLE